VWKIERMMSITKPNLWTWTKRLLPVALGAAGGYAYYYFIGCVSGTCPITSNPWISTAYGGLLGFFILPRQEKRRADDEQANAD
jgi:hypothetical protein